MFIPIILAGIVFLFLAVRPEANQSMNFAKQLSPGINLGNSLDVKGLAEKKNTSHSFSVSDYERYWGNPPISQTLLHQVKEAGFQTVRVPVSWGEHLDSDGMVDPLWMARVKEVVDMALAEELFVILDLHHEKWLVPTLEKEEEVHRTLVLLWKQIADCFSDYDERLLFEAMNEPRLEDSPMEWTGGDSEMQQVVNRLNEAFVRTIRESGNKNKKRYLLIPGYGNSYLKEPLQALQLPQDKRLIVSVHAYVPYDFALNEEGTREWSRDEEKDTGKIREFMSHLNQLFVQKEIPVLMTEFACIDRNNLQQRISWTEYVIEQAEANGVGYIWWDQGKDMALFDRNSGECIQKELVDVLVNFDTRK